MDIRKLNFEKEVERSVSYIRECKKFIFTGVFLFFFFSLIGFFVPAPVEIEERILALIKDLIEQTAGMSAIELVFFLFSNNSQASLVGIVFGVFFGIFPIISSIMNGYLLGFVAVRSVEFAGILSLWKLFPHGIFELPAFFISMGLGLRLGTFIFEAKKWESFKRFFSDSVRVFILVVIPLLIIAAFIEGILIAIL